MKKKAILTCYFTFLIFSLLTAENGYEKLRTEGVLPEETPAVGVATGERYRFIDDEAYAGRSGSSSCVRSYLYAGRTPVSVTEENQTLYMATDVRGSIRALTDRYGVVAARSDYDAFGVPLTEDALRWCGLGYAGKPYDFATQLYNYGFRDYSPDTGRFTTVDPIRYGQNWYAYVNGDPVNNVDLWGLINLKVAQLTMQDERWGKQVLGGSTKENASLVESEGCYLTGFSAAAITLTGNEALTPDYFNGMTDLFTYDQLFNSDAASEMTGITADYWTQQVQGNLTGKINELNQSDTEYVVMAQVPYDSNGHLHWVEIYGGVDEAGWVGVVGTSQNDSAGNSLRGVLPDTWLFSEDEVKINASEIVQLRTFTTGNTKESSKCGNDCRY